jgi:hypothetical protein
MSPGARSASMDGGEAVLSRGAVTASVLGLGAGGVALRSTPPTTLTFLECGANDNMVMET